MAEQSSELMLTILQGLQSDMGEVKRTLADHSVRLGHIDERLANMDMQFTYTLGLASGAEFKAQTSARRALDVEKRMDELTARVEQLEKAH